MLEHYVCSISPKHGSALNTRSNDFIRRYTERMMSYNVRLILSLWGEWGILYVDTYDGLNFSVLYKLVFIHKFKFTHCTLLQITKITNINIQYSKLYRAVINIISTKNLDVYCVYVLQRVQSFVTLRFSAYSHAQSSSLMVERARTED